MIADKVIPSILLFLLSTIVAQTAVPEKAINVNPIEVGSEAPDPEVMRPSGKKVKLSEVIRGKPTVLIFYRGGWCPYCSRQLEGLDQVERELASLGYRTIALSADSPEKVSAAKAQSNSAYALLSDSEMEAARAYGLAFKVDREGYERLLGFGINLEEASGETHHLLPVPAVFLIDEKGIVSFRYFNPDYRVRLSTTELLKAARRSRGHS